MYLFLHIVIVYTYFYLFLRNAACNEFRHLFKIKGGDPLSKSRDHPFWHVRAFHNCSDELFEAGKDGRVDLATPYYDKKQSEKLVQGTHETIGGVHKINVPEDSFGWVAESKAFVDKSLFIKHFMIEMKYSVVLAPKSFGKTTTLSMLRNFLEMPVNASGIRQDNRTSPSFKTFQRLKIYQQEPAFFNEHFSGYTVLSMSFNDLNVQSRQTFLPSFRQMVNRLYLAHPYLMQIRKLTNSEKKDFESHSSPHSKMNFNHLSSGGRILTRLLHRHFRKKTIILIDHIDAPAVNVMLNKNITDADAEFIFNILAKFVAKLISNNHQVHRSLLTGITSFGNVYTKEAAKIVYQSVFEDPKISQFFGITDIEVRELKNKFDNLEKMVKVRSVIGGYNVKGTWEALFNTKSVLRFLKTGKLEPEIVSIPPVIMLLKPVFQYDIFGSAIENSLETQTQITLQTQFRRKDLYNFRSLFHNGAIQIQEKEKQDLKKLEHKLFQYLLENGYYTVKYYTTENSVRVVVPNIEMKNELKRLIYTKKFFTDKFRIKESTLVNYMISIDQLSNNKMSFQVLCSSVVKIFENVRPKRDFEFQGPLFLYPALCPEAFKEVYSELHSDNQRSDVFIRRNDNSVIVIQLNIGFRWVTSNQSEYEGLKQIVSNNYYADKFDQPKNKVFIGLYVDRMKQCRISYLWNSDDFAHAKNVTLQKPMFLQEGPF